MIRMYWMEHFQTRFRVTDVDGICGRGDVLWLEDIRRVICAGGISVVMYVIRSD